MVDRSKGIGGRPNRCRFWRPVRMGNASGCFRTTRLATGTCRSCAAATACVATRSATIRRKRGDSGDPHWFIDRSHAPHHCPHRTDPGLVETIVSLRRRFPQWEPRKLLAMLERRHPENCWPAASTIGDILQQAGQIAPTKRRRKPLAQQRPFAAVEVVNDEWSVEFQGLVSHH